MDVRCVSLGPPHPTAHVTHRHLPRLPLDEPQLEGEPVRRLRAPRGGEQLRARGRLGVRGPSEGDNCAPSLARRAAAGRACTRVGSPRGLPAPSPLLLLLLLLLAERVRLLDVGQPHRHCRLQQNDVDGHRDLDSQRVGPVRRVQRERRLHRVRREGEGGACAAGPGPDAVHVPRRGRCLGRGPVGLLLGLGHLPAEVLEVLP
jgi:hypothetical protein